MPAVNFGCDSRSLTQDIIPIPAAPAQREAPIYIDSNHRVQPIRRVIQ